MSELTNDGALAPADDGALFSEIVSSAPAGDPAPEPQTQPDSQSQSQPTSQPALQIQPEPAIPPSRLREEADARRQAERERDELRGQLQAMHRQQHQPQSPEPADPSERIFSDPRGLVRDEAQQMLNPVIQVMHYNNRLIAGQVHGKDKVDSAVSEFDRLRAAGELHHAEVQQVMGSPNPFAAAVEMIQRRATLAEVGNDPAAYKQRVLEEAMKDPEFQKKVLEATRMQAQQAGQTITRPLVSTPPNINKVGAAALPDNQSEQSDADLYAATVSRKRA